MLTWGIKQHHVVSCVKASSFYQGRCDFLSSLVKLCTSGCAHWQPLQDINWRYRSTYVKVIGIVPELIMTFKEQE